MAFNKTDRDGAPMRRRGGMHRRKKVCVFCGKDNTIDYKDVNKLKDISLREKNPSKKNHRKLCKTSESFDSCYQESTSYRNYAFTFRINSETGRYTTYTKGRFERIVPFFTGNCFPVKYKRSARMYLGTFFCSI